MRIYTSIVGRICRALTSISMWAVFLMMMILVVDIIIRYFTAAVSLMGTYEMTEMIMLFVIYLALAGAQYAKGHIRITMLLEAIPWRARTFIEAAIAIITGIICFIVCNAGWTLSMTNYTKGLTTAVLFIPYWPFNIVLTIGLGALTLVFAMDAIDFIYRGIKKIKSKAEIEAEERREEYVLERRQEKADKKARRLARAEARAGKGGAA